MFLTEFHVKKFRNIVDSTLIPVQENVTCLVGKNESGKTALLQALYKLKPAYPSKFDLDAHYPRWLKIREVKNGTANDVRVIEAVFKIEDDDKKAVQDKLGVDVLLSDTYTSSMQYDGHALVTCNVDEAALIGTILSDVGVSDAIASRLKPCRTIEAIQTAIESFRKELQGQEDELVATYQANLQDIERKIGELLGTSSLWQVVTSILWDRVPTFFYFDEYSILPGRLDLNKLKTAPEEKPAHNSLQTARALLELAGTDISSLSNDEYEIRKGELEAVSNELTNQVFEYWRQNTSLRVEIDVDKETQDRPNGTVAVARFLDIRVQDQRHGYTNNFGQRSSGFQWFFSFLAAFSQFENLDTGVIVLLDEPALGLHGKAQGDFLRFINERLAESAQIIYTTHSPFMVEVDYLERVRIVEDNGPKEGSKTTTEVLGRDPDSLFPLQGALGYDIAQHLFIGPNNLLVEGTSDFTYLTVISDHLRTLKRSELDPRWRVLPAGGSSNIPAFVALIGPHLDATVLVDAGTEGMQRILKMTQTGILEGKRLITVGEITGASHADIEDLFSVTDYLGIFNPAMGNPGITEDDLPPGDRVVKRITRFRGDEFEHGIPADYLLRHRDTVCPSLSEGTLANFEKLINRINQTIAIT